MYNNVKYVITPNLASCKMRSVYKSQAYKHVLAKFSCKQLCLLSTTLYSYIWVQLSVIFN